MKMKPYFGVDKKITNAALLTSHVRSYPSRIFRVLCTQIQKTNWKSSYLQKGLWRKRSVMVGAMQFAQGLCSSRQRDHLIIIFSSQQPPTNWKQLFNLIFHPRKEILSRGR